MAAYKPLGSITIERTYDGNYTGFFVPKVEYRTLWQEMRSAARAGLSYRIRSEINKDSIEAFNEPVRLSTDSVFDFMSAT